MTAQLSPGSLSTSSGLGLGQFTSSTLDFMSSPVKWSWLEQALLNFLDSKIWSFLIYIWFIPRWVFICQWHSTLAMLTNFYPSRQKWLWCLELKHKENLNALLWAIFFSVLDKMNISMTDKLNHHRIIQSNQHFLDSHVMRGHAPSNTAWKKARKVLSEKMLHLFYNKHHHNFGPGRD